MGPSHNPTTSMPSRHPTTADPTRRPTSGTYLTPEPSRTYLTPEPTKKPTEKPTEDQSGWGEPQPTPKPPKTKAPKPTKAPRTKKPRPTKAPKTSKPTKAPKTKKPKPTRAPKPVKTPSPTHGGDYGPGDEGNGGYGSKKDKNTMAPLDHQEMMAVDVNGTMETTFTGYSAQTEIAGLCVIVVALLIIGYSMMCKKDKDAEYVAIEDPKSAQPIA